MKEDAIEGFMAGADDYITKPFSMEELLLRLKAILRRAPNQSLKNNTQSEFKIGKYTFDYNRQLLIIPASPNIEGGARPGKQQKLTTKEADLLKLLCLNSNDIVDRNIALKSIWQDDNYFTGRSMDVYITKLRKYLKDDSNVEILNIHGRGFKLRM